MDAAPNLTTLHLPYLHPRTLRSIPTKSLTKLELLSRSATWEHVSRFLRQCPSLISLQLFTPEPPQDQFINGGRVVLPTLEVLHVHSPGFGHVMSTPNVKQLHLTAAAFAVEKTSPLGPLPALKHLKLFRPTASLMENWQPVPSFSEISTLTLEASHSADYLLAVLAQCSGGAGPGDDDPKHPVVTFFPLLRKLNLKNVHSSHLISLRALCALALGVLDLRPELYLECDSGFFATAAMSLHDRFVRYGARIYERPPP